MSINRKQAYSFLYCETHNFAIPPDIAERVKALQQELGKIGLWLTYVSTIGPDTVDKEPCAKCGQFDFGQTGEYPCSTCGLPTSWDTGGHA